MTDVQVFNHSEFGDVRVIEIDGEPWFVGKDVALALGYKDTDQALRKHVPDKYKLIRQINGLGQMRSVIIINEAGLYKLVFASKLPKAVEFSDWVCEDVMPSIRKTGSYALPNKPSVEAGLQRVGLLVRVAEHKAVPQSEQLRLLNMAVRELTGTELNFGKSTQESQSMELGIMDLPEVFGVIKRKRSKKFGKYTFYFYPVIEIADMVGVPPLKFNQFADEHGLKCARNGFWERVKTPQGDAREFMYTQEVTLQYSE